MLVFSNPYLILLNLQEKKALKQNQKICLNKLLEKPTFW